MGHGNDPPSPVAAHVAVDGQLFEMHPAGGQGGFLAQFPVGRVQDFLTVVIEEPARQGQHALKRIFAPFDEQNAQASLAQRQDHEIDREEDEWR